MTAPRTPRRIIRALATGVVGVVAVVGVGWGTATPAGAAAWDPFPDATGMVTAQFWDFLGRAPTGTESSLWVGRLTTGTHGRSHLVASLRGSADNLSYVDPVARLYMSALNRLPDALGLLYWVGERRSGARTPQQVADVFVTTTQYAAEYGGLTDTQFVDELYMNVLGWAPGPADVAYWVGELTSCCTRANVLKRFGETPQAVATLKVDVDISVGVIAMFRRNPTGSDIDDFDEDASPPEWLAEVLFQDADYYYP
jgi:hypothetical protein